jgi:hypothetical protein
MLTSHLEYFQLLNNHLCLERHPPIEYNKYEYFLYNTLHFVTNKIVLVNQGNYFKINHSVENAYTACVLDNDLYRAV